MEKLTDRLLLKTNFGRKLISRLIVKSIKEKLGKDVEIYMGDVDAEYSDDELTISITNCTLTMDGKSVMDLLNL